jgi:hypothetical protein
MPHFRTIWPVVLKFFHMYRQTVYMLLIGAPEDCECAEEGTWRSQKLNNPFIDNWEYTVLRFTNSNIHISG